MSSAETQQHTFPAAPPSLSAGDYEMRDYYAQQHVTEPAPHQAPYLTPYLGLRARLSQVWINRWTILLILVLVRVLIAVKDLDGNLDSARSKALSACTSVETVGSNMASMPHYMSQGVNELTAKGVERAVNGLMSMLSLSITGVEEIVLFVINFLTSTYVCLITLVVGGSLTAAVDLIEDISGFLNKTLGSIGDDMAKVSGGFQDSLNTFLDAFDSIPFVTGDIPKINLTSQINKMENLQLPTGLKDDLEDLKKNIPDFEDVHNFTNSLIRLPFEKVKGLINESLNTYEFDRSVFPIPAKEKLTFCSDSNGINDFFDGLVDLERNAKKIFIGVIIALAIIVCIPMAYQEIHRWRTMRRRAELVQQQATDRMDVVYIASRPYTASFGLKLANRFSSQRRRVAVRWAVAYATSTPALFVLSLGLAGLFACLCQYALLKSIEQEVPELTGQVANFTDKVVVSLNNASAQWALQTNNAIKNTSANINHDVFGWVEISTTAVNDTLNGFIDTMNEALNKTFGGTPLYEPVTGTLKCLIGIKLEGIQKGLTWVHDHAHIDFPLMPNDTFTLGAAASLSDSDSDDSFLASPGSEASDAISGAITTLIRKLKEGIEQEAIISTMVVLLWVLVAVIGIVRALILFGGRDKTRAEGGQAYIVDPANSQMRGHDIPAPPYEYPVNKAAPYTLQPRPFPTFEPDTEPEKMGQVERSFGVTVTEPTHLRASSHGDMAERTPINEKADPFAGYSR